MEITLKILVGIRINRSRRTYFCFITLHCKWSSDDMVHISWNWTESPFHPWLSLETESITFKMEYVHGYRSHWRAKKLNNRFTECFLEYWKTRFSSRYCILQKVYGTRKSFPEQHFFNLLKVIRNFELMWNRIKWI